MTATAPVDLAPIDRTELAKLRLDLIDAFASLGVVPHVERDFRKRLCLVRGIEDPTWKVGRDQAAFDPEESGLSSDDAFWLNVRALGASADGPANGPDGLAAHLAVRVYRDASLAGLFADGRLSRRWATGEALRFAPSRETDHIRGALAYAGGAWVAPGRRSRRLGALIGLQAKALLLEAGGCDYKFAFVVDGAARAGMPARYRFSRLQAGAAMELADGRSVPFWLAYDNRDDMVDELRRFAAEFAAERGASR